MTGAKSLCHIKITYWLWLGQRVCCIWCWHTRNVEYFKNQNWRRWWASYSLYDKIPQYQMEKTTERRRKKFVTKSNCHYTCLPFFVCCFAEMTRKSFIRTRTSKSLTRRRWLRCVFDWFGLPVNLPKSAKVILLCVANQLAISSDCIRLAAQRCQ